jgi:hypothetical protein
MRGRISFRSDRAADQRGAEHPGLGRLHLAVARAREQDAVTLVAERTAPAQDAVTLVAERTAPARAPQQILDRQRKQLERQVPRNVR